MTLVRRYHLTGTGVPGKHTLHLRAACSAPAGCDARGNKDPILLNLVFYSKKKEIPGMCGKEDRIVHILSFVTPFTFQLMEYERKQGRGEMAGALCKKTN